MAEGPLPERLFGSVIHRTNRSLTSLAREMRARGHGHGGREAHICTRSFIAKINYSLSLAPANIRPSGQPAGGPITKYLYHDVPSVLLLYISCTGLYLAGYVLVHTGSKTVPTKYPIPVMRFTIPDGRPGCQ
jgi:hypothetical protein